MAVPRNKRPTIQQVADTAGVCKTTVSHAFSGRRPVSDTVRRKILRVAEQLGYRPHYVAQSLLRGHTKTIAVLVRDLVNPYNSLYLQAIEQSAWARGYRVYVCACGTDQDKIASYLGSFSNGQADGVLVATSAVRDQAVIDLARNGYPVVAPLRTIPGHEHLWTTPADIGGAFRRLLDHLYDLGHRQLGFIWHIPSHTKHRLSALEGFAAERGVPVNQGRMVDGVHTVEQAIVAAEKLLRRRPEITALVCANDMLAVGSLVAAHRLRLAVPAELTVTGFGDVPMGRYCTPAVTTVRLPIAEIAELAVDILVSQVQLDRPPLDRNDSLPAFDLLIRGSSGPAGDASSAAGAVERKRDGVHA